VALIEKSKRTIVYTDLQDELGELSPVELRGVHVGTDYERFRLKARAYLREHGDHIALHKLRRNRQLTPKDLRSLEQMLLDRGAGDATDVARAGDEAHGLGPFIRSLVGLDRQAATDAFSSSCPGPSTRPQRSTSSISSSRTSPRTACWSRNGSTNRRSPTPHPRG
jgi:type I restriction enzyme R subunit